MAFRKIPIGTSSNVLDVQFDDETGDLLCTFVRGSGIYKQLTVQEAEGISQAGSPGKYLNTFIAPSHVWERLS